MLSIIITTCAGSKDPGTLSRKGSEGNRKPYGARAPALRKMLTEYTKTGAEVIVVGEWEEGEDYTYIELPGKHKAPWDHATQRHAGFLASSGDILLFLNDDHWLDPEYFDQTVKEVKRSGAIGFQMMEPHDGGWRWNVSAGKNHNPHYIPGHASAFKREIIEKVPWEPFDKPKTDVLHSHAILSAGYTYKVDAPIPVYDVETGDLENVP